MSVDLLSKVIHLEYNKAEIAKFRKNALSNKNEILAFLIGKVRREKKGLYTAYIDNLYYPVLAVSNPNTVRQAEEFPKGCIGTIHSHPETETLGPSADDIHSSILQEEKIYGIYHYFTRKGQRPRTQMLWLAPGRIVVLK